ncbi:MAG TPA: TonB-dependent receptor [Candidatus Saccharimonadales bacterium]|nr:TonB-dependent receptor [Candidatus Saccharimonadales bacterium]
MIQFRVMRYIFPAILGLYSVLLVPSPASAQYDTGSIVGIVHDATGGEVSGATVKITNTKTGRVYELTTDARGEYEATGLPAGVYVIETDKNGFKTAHIQDIVLYATDHRSINVDLAIGSASEQVTVVADTLSVNTQSSDLGASIDSNKVSNLPLNGRDFTALIALVPGSVTTGAFGQNSLGGYETTFAGVNVLLDGADATRIDVNAVSTQLGRQESRISRASIDSIQEFKVLSSTYSAEYGRSTGDIVNVITKSGGNTIHGTVFDYFRNDVMDAKNYFETSPTPLRLNQFGGNVSGPIKKDKLFYFVNYEGVRQIVTNPIVNVPVVTADTRLNFAPVMQPVIATVPLPNVPGPVIFVGQGPGGSDIVRNDLGYFDGSLRNTLREDTGSVKIDYNATAKDSFAFRFNVADSFTNTQYGIATGQFSPSTSRNFLAKGSWNRTISTSLLNEFGIAFNRPQSDSLGGGDGFPTFQCSAFFGCGGANTFGTAPGPALFSSLRPQHSLQFLDTVTWIRGRHTIKAGLDIRHAVTHDTLQPQAFLAFDNLSDFEIGQALQLSTLGYNEVGVQNTNYGFFVQDDYRVSPRLTLNLGLRYEYNTVLQGDLIGNFDIATLTLDPIGKPLYHPDRNNFGPRVGFSWDPTGKGKTVVRGGFGMFYSPMLTGAALGLASNYQQSFNVNIFDVLFFGTRTCDPPYFLTYPIPDPLPTCTPALPANVTGLDQNIRDTYSMHWSLGVQHEIVKNTILEVSYVGNRGVKLPAGAAYAGQELNLSPFPGGADQISDDFGQVRRFGNFINSNYHALQASVRRRISKGINVDANYTFAHETDDAVNILTGAYQNSHDPNLDYASGDIDVRHNFTLGAVWDLPVASSLPRRLAEGWQISSLVQARSGLPYTIAVAAPFLGADQIRPNLTGEPIHLPGASFPGTPTNPQVNPHAFIPPPDGEFGEVGRNSERGPGFTQWDASFSKTTAITENLKIQFRGELFNILNHPNFSNPDGFLTDSTFGQSTSTIGNHVGTGTSRQAQLVLKLLF